MEVRSTGSATPKVLAQAAHAAGDVEASRAIHQAPSAEETHGAWRLPVLRMYYYLSRVQYHVAWA